MKTIVVSRDLFFKKAEDELGCSEMEGLLWAYSLAKHYHRGQKRDNSDRYFNHCRGVAVILLELGPTSVSELIEGLMHDVYEDQFMPEGMLGRLFGDKIDDDLRVLSKEEVIYKSSGLIEKRHRELSDYFGRIADGSVTVRRVKLADRLHNLEEMDIQSKDRKLRKVEETRKFILPIARNTDRRFHYLIEKACRDVELDA